MTPRWLQQSTVLICEHDDERRERLRRWFDDVGAATVEAGTGAEAIEFGRDVDLIVLDADLPDVDGPAVVRGLRGDPRTAGIPIIERSSAATDADVVEALALGVDAYLVEPVSREIMIATADAALRGHDVARRLEVALSGGGRGVFDWDVASGVVRWNDELERLHRLEPGSFGGTIDAFRDSVHPDDRDDVDADLTDALRSGADVSFAFRFLRADGTVGHMESFGRVFRAPNGEPVRMLGLAQDVSERVEQRRQIDQLRRLAATLAGRRTSAGVIAAVEREIDPDNVRLTLTDAGAPHDPDAVMSFVAGDRRLDLHWAPVADGVDRTQAIAIGELTGAAIDRALQYETERSNARAMQHALLPAEPSGVPGWRVDSVYVPASENDRIGGDFFDVLTTDATMLVIVGDVAGHGVRAAGQMAATRLMLRTLLEVAEGDLVDVERRARACFGPVCGTDGPHVTVALARLDRATGDGELITLGHPAPLHRSGTSTGLVETHPNPPLGLGIRSAPPATVTRFRLDVGDWLAMYTDGVFERRSRDVERAAVDAARRLGQAPTALDVVGAGEDAADLTVDDRAVVVVQRTAEARRD